ncbi:MAG TPA: circadian clock protein KaiC [Verrucomicrobiae bacterium]|nr:circadian clock protein KaiC [Verrucomicrobiae bacterium]
MLMSQGKMVSINTLKKVPTGIAGFDEITGGGLPAGRPTLICGGAGCGKSLFSTEFLVRGALQFNEPGVLMTFEETADDIKKNVASLGFDIARMIEQKKIFIDHVHVDRSEIEENGEYDLEGLFVRLNHAIKIVGAKRVALDTIETLFAGLQNQAILRSELRRLFGWLKEKGMTTVITGERGEGALTRQGLEEYVSDCVVLLDHRVIRQVSTRRMRIVKYRGSIHGTNEYPFLIGEAGITVLPITTAEMDYGVSSRRVPTGVPELDQMLGGKGYFQGSTVLLSGSAGTGKSSMASHLANVTCSRGERCIYFSFEESQAQIIRNMKSIGVDLESHVRKGLLKFHATRPTVYGLEMHLALIHKMIEEFKPVVTIFDPVTNLQAAGTLDDSVNMLIRMIDFLRKKNITCFMISLTPGGSRSLEMTDVGMSSIVDTWLLLRDVESGGERNRLMYVLKSRGMAHSNQVREFLITSKGVKLVEAYLGSEGVLTGSARVNQQNLERAHERLAADEMQRKKLALQHRRKSVEAQIEALRAGFLAEQDEVARDAASDDVRRQQVEIDRRSMAASRRVSNAKTQL